MSLLKKVLSTTLAVLVASVFLFSFPALTSAAHASEIHAYTQESSGQQFEIGPDSLITVSLERNPSTGYHWKDVPFKPFGRSNIVVSVFPELGSEYFPSQPVMPGSGGVEVFAYGVESMGLGVIQLELISPSGAVADTVEIGLMVVNQ
ncbi:MAG: protease inhibitor I42 family protein [Symploca sp. SIO2E6]|nr:protease inhibitor I42 family protein [Symploca sp. SIO2E6]